jgi:hypothetical protein
MLSEPHWLSSMDVLQVDIVRCDTIHTSSLHQPSPRYAGFSRKVVLRRKSS